MSEVLLEKCAGCGGLSEDASYPAWDKNPPYEEIGICEDCAKSWEAEEPGDPTNSYRIYRMINCKNCERAACRLMASRDEPGPAPGEMKRCPECGDRRWVVPITVASWLEGEDSDGRKLVWTPTPPTTFTIPIGYEVPQCNCGRTPIHSHNEYVKGGAKLGIYYCDHQLGK